MSIRLSICIPTYNRAAVLGAALDSVIRQATDEMEIVVSDNASTDNTEQLVHQYQTRFARIVYHRNAGNLGADRNYLNAIELAQGDYCWLLGSDDALAENAIPAVMPILSDADVYLTDVRAMSFTMNSVLVEHLRMLASNARTRYDCRDHAQLVRYFCDAVGIGSLFSYLSAIIVRRSAWQAQPVIEELVGSAWIHVAQIFQMLRAGARIEYVGLPLVMQRTQNDSFLAALGYTRRRLVDLDYPRVARTVFGDQPEVLALVTRVVARYVFTYRVMLSDKRSALRADGPDVARELVMAYEREFSGLPGYRLKIVVWQFLPNIVLEFLWKARGILSFKNLRSLRRKTP